MHFCACTSLKSIYLPKSIKLIDYASFSGCNNLKDVYYEGDESDWNKIKSLQGFNATIHFNKVIEKTNKQTNKKTEVGVLPQRRL